MKQKFINYFENLINSSLILLVILTMLSFNNLKPDIIIRFFFICSLLLSLFFYPRQTLIFIKDSPRKLKTLWLFLFILGAFFNIFVFNFTSNLTILFLIGLWIISISNFRLERKVSIRLALGLLILSSFLLISGRALISEKTATWVYIFITIGVIQSLIENQKKKREI